MNQEAYIALGSNLGERATTLRTALRWIDEHPAVNVRDVSRFWDTAPMYVKHQPRFLNAVARVETSLEPWTLLEVLQQMEQRAGRKRGPEQVRFGARILDLDLLDVEGTRLAIPGLELPHPRLHERAFVLLPLREVAPGWMHPGLNVGIDALCARLPEAVVEGVQVWEGATR